MRTITALFDTYDHAASAVRAVKDAGISSSDISLVANNTAGDYNAQDGERIGMAQYLVPTGTAFDKAFELAQRIATNAPLTNYALMHALPRIAEQPADQGFFTEAMMAAIAQSAPEAKERVKAFLDGKAAKVKKA